MGTTATAISINAGEPGALGDYGISKVLNVADNKLKTFNGRAYANAIQQAAEKEGTKVIILSSSTDTKFLAPILTALLKGGYVPNVVATPETTAPFRVKRTVFSNKGFAHTELDTDIKIIGVSNNAFGSKENKVTATVESFAPDLPGNAFNITSIDIDKVVGKATIADADIVVSGGRGLKGPEN